jgi:hypothetical protein
VVVRAFYLRRLFPGFRMIGHAARAITPTVPAAGAVLLARVAESGSRTATTAIAEVVLYLAVTVAATWFFERPLLRETIGYVRAGVAER